MYPPSLALFKHSRSRCFLQAILLFRSPNMPLPFSTSFRQISAEKLLLPKPFTTRFHRRPCLSVCVVAAIESASLHSSRCSPRRPQSFAGPPSPPSSSSLAVQAITDILTRVFPCRPVHIILRPRPFSSGSPLSRHISVPVAHCRRSSSSPPAAVAPPLHLPSSIPEQPIMFFSSRLNRCSPRFPSGFVVSPSPA